MRLGVTKLTLLALFTSSSAYAGWSEKAWPSETSFRLSPSDYLEVTNVWARKVDETLTITYSNTTNYSEFVFEMDGSHTTPLGPFTNSPAVLTTVYYTDITADASTNLVDSWEGSETSNKVFELFGDAFVSVQRQRDAVGVLTNWYFDVPQIWAWDTYMALRERALAAAGGGTGGFRDLSDGIKPKFYHNERDMLVEAKNILRGLLPLFVITANKSSGNYNNYLQEKDYLWGPNNIEEQDVPLFGDPFVFEWQKLMATRSTLPTYGTLSIIEEVGLPYDVDTTDFQTTIPGWQAGDLFVEEANGPFRQVVGFDYFNYTPYKRYELGGWREGIRHSQPGRFVFVSFWDETEDYINENNADLFLFPNRIIDAENSVVWTDSFADLFEPERERTDQVEDTWGRPYCFERVFDLELEEVTNTWTEATDPDGGELNPTNGPYQAVYKQYSLNQIDATLYGIEEQNTQTNDYFYQETIYWPCGFTNAQRVRVDYDTFTWTEDDKTNKWEYNFTAEADVHVGFVGLQRYSKVAEGFDSREYGYKHIPAIMERLTETQIRAMNGAHNAETTVKFSYTYNFDDIATPSLYSMNEVWDYLQGAGWVTNETTNYAPNQLRGDSRAIITAQSRLYTNEYFRITSYRGGWNIRHNTQWSFPSNSIPTNIAARADLYVGNVFKYGFDTFKGYTFDDCGYGVNEDGLEVVKTVGPRTFPDGGHTESFGNAIPSTPPVPDDPLEPFDTLYNTDYTGFIAAGLWVFDWDGGFEYVDAP
jgi:hypothetical protein